MLRLSYPTSPSRISGAAALESSVMSHVVYESVAGLGSGARDDGLRDPCSMKRTDLIESQPQIVAVL